MTHPQAQLRLLTPGPFLASTPGSFLTSGQVYGRAIDRDQHLYLPGPRCGLVNAQGAATADEVIFTESVIDALSFLEAGIANVVPLYGKNGWTPDHDALLEKHRIRRVVLALDSDEAGGKASAALAVKLRGRGLAVEEVCFP